MYEVEYIQKPYGIFNMCTPGWKTPPSNYFVLATFQWAMDNGHWTIGNGHQAMGNRRWVMGNGLRAMGDGQWAMGNGLWAMGDGYWIMAMNSGSGQ